MLAEKGSICLTDAGIVYIYDIEDEIVRYMPVITYHRQTANGATDYFTQTKTGAITIPVWAENPMLKTDIGPVLDQLSEKDQLIIEMIRGQIISGKMERELSEDEIGWRELILRQYKLLTEKVNSELWKGEKE